MSSAPQFVSRLGTPPSYIILLCPLSDAPYLATLLTVHNPTLLVRVATDRAALDAHLAAAPPDVRVIGFCTPVVVPVDTLVRLTWPAYNIHPGVPEYPGKYPMHFAYYERASRFGATVHEMVAKVDAGPISAVIACEVPPDADVPWLQVCAKQAAIRLFISLAPAFATSPEPLGRIPVSWSDRQCSQKALDRLCVLPPDFDPDDLDRRIAAFSSSPGVRFHTYIRGRRFDLAP